jgi:hypothetical protein
MCAILRVKLRRAVDDDQCYAWALDVNGESSERTRGKQLPAGPIGQRRKVRYWT